MSMRSTSGRIVSSTREVRLHSSSARACSRRAIMNESADMFESENQAYHERGGKGGEVLSSVRARGLLSILHVRVDEWKERGGASALTCTVTAHREASLLCRRRRALRGRDGSFPACRARGHAAARAARWRRASIGQGRPQGRNPARDAA